MRAAKVTGTIASTGSLIYSCCMREFRLFECSRETKRERRLIWMQNRYMSEWLRAKGNCQIKGSFMYVCGSLRIFAGGSLERNASTGTGRKERQMDAKQMQ